MPPEFNRHTLRQLRLRAQLSQRALAAAIGTSYQAVSDWERGRCRPEIDSLTRLATLLGCKIDDLFAPLADLARTGES